MVICGHCSIEFSQKRQTQKYCSSKCYRRAKKLRSMKRSPGKPWYNGVCEYCGGTFVAWHRQKFCSHKCSSEARKKYLDVPDCLAESHRKLDKNIGYVRLYVPMHPEANTRGYVYEHRIVAESILGRRLCKNEVVHHKNGLRWDNREENLAVMDKVAHAKLQRRAAG